MKNSLAACVVPLLVGMAAITAGQNRGGGPDIRDRFTGGWRLARLEQAGADGKVRRVDGTGLLVYTREGDMSVQVMERSPQTSSAAAPEQYSQGGYEASWGTYRVDERAHTFTFHVEGALVRSLIGQDLARAYEFSGKQLIVHSTRSDEHWRVVWERD